MSNDPCKLTVKQMIAMLAKKIRLQAQIAMPEKEDVVSKKATKKSTTKGTKK